MQNRSPLERSTASRSGRLALTAGIALMLAVFNSSNAFADNLLGNIHVPFNDNGSVSTGLYDFNMTTSEFQAAVKFTTPTIPFILDGIDLRLQMALSGGPPLVTVHQDDAAGDEPGTLIAALTNPALSDSVDTFRFTPSEVVRLEANTTYWFLVDHEDNTAEFFWKRSSSPANEPSGLATFGKVIRSSDDGTTYGNFTEFPNFQVNGTEVVYQPDLSIGESDKPGRAKKDDLYNTSGAGQKHVVRFEGRGKEKASLYVQNDGNDVDTITLRSNVPRKKLYRYKIFKITGGKENITASVKSGAGFPFADLAPGERITCLIDLKGKNKRGNHTVKYTGTSLKDALKQDLNQLKVKAKN